MGLFKHHGLLEIVVFLAAACTVQADFVQLKATVVYDDQGACTGSSSGIPVQVTASPISTTCAASATCSETPTGSSLFPATVCSVTDGTASGDFIETTLPYLFGSSPYVIVEKYTTGQSCVASALSSITTYLADGKCHKTGSATSYRATRNADNSATVQPYTDVVCGTAGTLLTVTAAQGTSNSCVSDTKVYGANVTPLYLSLNMNYDTTVNACTSGLPSLVTMGVVGVDACTPTSTCTGASAPYTGTKCSSTLAYQSDMATAFGVNPYVIVETYIPAQSCVPSALVSITACLADGKCHKIGTVASYTATRAANGSGVVKTYTDSAVCATISTTLTMTAAQVSGNSCVNDGNGILDTKVYGNEATAMTLYLSSIASYDTNNDCSGMPTKLETSVVPMDYCAPSLSCSGSSAPYTGTMCSSTLTFEKDVAATFGSNPYVIVKSYNPGKNCAAADLTGISTYLADGQCHKMSASTSYTATNGADGSATILTYASADCTVGGTRLLDVTAAQVKGQSCANDGNGVVDTKIYGAGVTTQYLQSTLAFDTIVGSCTPPAVPTIVRTTVVNSTACTATANCVGSAVPYTSTMCSTATTFQMDIAKLYGTKPYVILEFYIPGRYCAGTKLSSMTAYLADGKCHKTGSATSYTATKNTDGSTTIVTYATWANCEGDSSTLSVTAAQIAGNSCANDGNGILDVKVFGSGVYLSSTVTYDTKMGNCQAPMVPTQLFTTVVNEGACTASNSCVGSAPPYNGTLCSSTSSYQKDVATVFGTNPYVIMETYAAGKNCTKLEHQHIHCGHQVPSNKLHHKL